MAPKKPRGTPPTLKTVWLHGVVAGLIAVAAIIVKNELDRRHGLTPHSSVVTWLTVPILLGGTIGRRNGSIPGTTIQ